MRGYGLWAMGYGFEIMRGHRDAAPTAPSIP
jgi:hypothetical protein